MEGKGDSPNSFQKKSFISWLFPVNPWRVCLPIFKATKRSAMLCCFLLSSFNCSFLKTRFHLEINKTSGKSFSLLVEAIWDFYVNHFHFLKARSFIKK